MLVGKTTIAQLKEAPYNEWFTPFYENYTVNTKQLQNVDISGFSCQIFLATWCPDCHKWLPAFIKIMEHLNVSENQLVFIALDRDKNTIEGFETVFNVSRVPTFVFYKKGEEVGRIIEKPVLSLENELHILLN